MLTMCHKNGRKQAPKAGPEATPYNWVQNNSFHSFSIKFYILLCLATFKMTNQTLRHTANMQSPWRLVLQAFQAVLIQTFLLESHVCPPNVDLWHPANQDLFKHRSRASSWYPATKGYFRKVYPKSLELLNHEGMYSKRKSHYIKNQNKTTEFQE